MKKPRRGGATDNKSIVFSTVGCLRSKVGIKPISSLPHMSIVAFFLKKYLREKAVDREASLSTAFFLKY